MHRLSIPSFHLDHSEYEFLWDSFGSLRLERLDAHQRRDEAILVSTLLHMSSILDHIHSRPHEHHHYLFTHPDK